jgi:hypothetical protein
LGRWDALENFLMRKWDQELSSGSCRLEHLSENDPRIDRCLSASPRPTRFFIRSVVLDTSAHECHEAAVRPKNQWCDCMLKLHFPDVTIQI